MDCGSSNGRFQALKILYECLTLGSVIIFVNVRHAGKYNTFFCFIVFLQQTTEAAQSLARRMSEEGHAVSVIYGKLEGLERKRVMQQFRTGS
jgi:ATP-dependent RNA helicase DDX19/DBP5